MMELIVKDDVFVTDNTNVVNTIFCIQFGGYYFPSNTWTDFTFPILEEWKNNLLRSKYADNISFKLYFHDGPFWLEVYKNEKMELKVECINDKVTRKTELVIYCGYFEFLHNIYKALKTFAKVLYKNNMHKDSFMSVYKQTILSIEELRDVLRNDSCNKS